MRGSIILATGVLLGPMLQAQQDGPRGEWILRELNAHSILFSGGQEPTPMKCGTAAIVLAFTRQSELPPDLRLTLQQGLERPVRQTSRVSPSGRFRIHYDTSGVHQPALISLPPASGRISNSFNAYVDSVAAIFDYCWDVEVTLLGYRPPPPDGTIGGGPEYDVFITELSRSEFGSTNWFSSDLITNSPNERYNTYILIDNDYLGYRTEGMQALRVTAAHEFHHAIQVGAYGIWPTTPSSDFYFYELEATWMEDVVFNQINDYYFDLPFYFQGFRDSQSRPLSFTTFDQLNFGYERTVFAHFLARRFGRNVIRQIWEGMRSEPFFGSIQTVLGALGTDLSSEFALFTNWNYFTADRADTSQYYPEGDRYPRWKPNASARHNGSFTSVQGGALPLSSQLIEFQVDADTIAAMVTNLRLDEAQRGTGAANDFRINLLSGVSSTSHQLLANGLKAEFSVNRNTEWRLKYFQASSRADAGASTDPVPNPLRLNSASRLTLPIQNTSQSEAEIFVLSSSLDLVYSSRYRVVEEFGKRRLVIPANDLRPHVSTGVYFVVAHFSDAELRWKVAIVQ